MEVYFMKKQLFLLTTLITTIFNTQTKQPIINNQTLNIMTINFVTPSDDHVILPVADVVEKIEEKTFNEKYIVNVKTQDEQKNIVSRVSVEPNIIIDNNDEWVTILCRGFRGTMNLNKPRMGKCLLTIYRFLRDEAITTPTTITFDWFDDMKTFNFSQYIDQQSLRRVHQQVTNKSTKIFLLGECMGAMTILHYAQTINQPVAGMLLFSPTISLDHIAQACAKTRLKNFFFGNRATQGLVNSLFRNKLIFPNYSKKIERKLLQQLTKIKNQTIIIYHLVDTDPIVNNDGIIYFVNQLNKNNTVYLHLVKNKDLRHGRIGQDESTKFITHAFYQHLGAPHNEQYAQQGLELLEHARYAGNNPIKAFLAITDQINDTYKFTYHV